jgi:hypothetical protein
MGQLGNHPRASSLHLDLVLTAASASRPPLPLDDNVLVLSLNGRS